FRSLSKNIEKATKIALDYQKIFGKENFYLEMQYHPNIPEQKIVNDTLKSISKQTDIGLVATHDTHYLRPDDNEAHEILLAVQTGKDIDDETRLSMKDNDFSFQPPDFFTENFKDTPDALENTVKITNMCNLELELGKVILPHFEVPDNKTSLQYLKELCLAGLQKKYDPDNNTAKKRMDYELSVIEKTGFADYFLIVSDFINWAKNNKILVGPGRGSAAGSIVSYCLNITELDPLKYDLLFERFLNPDRIAPPDIDTDFADDRRDEVIKYVSEKYGADHVCHIITFGIMKARMAIRDCGRAMGIPYQEVDKIAKLIPFGFDLKQTLEEVADFKNLYSSDPQVKKLVDMTKKLEGVARHASVHAAGIVISKRPLVEYLPLQFGTKGNEEIIAQYTMNDIESIGLIKMDFLGLSNLTVIKNALRIIRKIKDKEIDINNLPLDDLKTYNLLAKAQTTGVFQLESEGMKRYLKELKPTEINDIIAMVALYRPGPIEFIPDYIAGKHGTKRITYLHPKLEPILKNTYGIAVYQEQIMQIARDIAGFSLGEADVLRKAVGKKIKKLLMKQREKFISGAIKNGVKKETAEKLFSFIEPFARYGFNKSHAASYAIIAYQTAYLKANYPSEFMAALLTSDSQNLDRIAIEISECEKMGIKILPPNINDSFVEFGVIKESGQITFGLATIKNVGIGVAEAIVEERKKNGKYKNLEDFLQRLGPDVINKKVIESLAKAGALDIFYERNKIVLSIEQILKYSSSFAKQKAGGQVSLFGENIKAEFDKLNLPEIEPTDSRQRLAWEKEFLGIFLTDHPLNKVKKTLEKSTRAIANLSKEDEGKKIRVGGIITDIKKIITKSSEPMLFVKLEDVTAITEIIVFPKLLKQNFLVWQPDNIIIVEGRISNKDDTLKIIAEKAEELGQQMSLETIDDFEKKNGNTKKNFNRNKKTANDGLVLNIPSGFSKEKMDKIKIILMQFPGNAEVFLKIFHDGEIKKIKIKNKVNLQKETLVASLTEILGKDRINIA
ncbi:MAG: DNA polymerase III subunit alpha, partial [Patescibacteria group bacterium]|nr:DNA polymerase III subunit alpha [Patescibacteria group bacterium]